MFAFGCGPPTLTVVETDPFDAAQRRIESNAHRALVERAQILLQSSQPNLDELQHLSEQLKQELMESRVSKAGIEPKSRRRMEAALSDIAHRVSMHPIVPTQSIEINWSFQAGQPPFHGPSNMCELCPTLDSDQIPSGVRDAFFTTDLIFLQPKAPRSTHPAQVELSKQAGEKMGVASE